MARIRSIKPEFFANEKLSQLPIDTHLLAAALLCHADDEGYFLAHPGLVRAACLPLREDYRSPTVMLQELSDIGYLALQTTSEGKALGKILKFRAHQTINKPSASKLKTLWTVPEDSRSATVGLPGGTGNREQGKEQGKGAASATPPASSAEPESCEPPPASPPSTPKSLDPETSPELREAANVAALATPFFRAKPNVNATAVTLSHRREVYAAARWEMENDHHRNPSQADALTNLRKLFEKHERGSPDEFQRYRDKPLKFYFADKPYHNTPRKPFAVVKAPMKPLDVVAREEREQAMANIAKEKVQ